MVRTLAEVSSAAPHNATHTRSTGPVRCLLGALALFVAGCAQVPTSGPSGDDIQEAQARAGTGAVQVVDVDNRVARQLQSLQRQRLFSEAFAPRRAVSNDIGPGDTLEISIWEAPPATLFGGGTSDLRQGTSASRQTTLPEQMVGRDGFVTVPFAGRVQAGGKTPQALEADIVARLKGKANAPEVIVRTIRNGSAVVTVVGEVTNSLRFPLSPGGERLLDALAAAGGVRQPVGKMTLQITRDDGYLSMPLDMVIRDPRQNVSLQPGDVVTALFQPLSFTVLGATGKNEEVNFETQGISLAQALARSGGLLDSRSDPQGVFIFRFEAANALTWPRQPVTSTPEGLVPVVYRINLRDPASFFVMQSFAVNNKDVLYVSNSPAAELQKFLNLAFSIAYPVLNTIQLTR